MRNTLLLLSLGTLTALAFQNCSGGLPDTSSGSDTVNSVSPPVTPLTYPPPVVTPPLQPTVQPSAQIKLSSFTELTTYHSGCTSAAPMSSACMVAASRLCQQHYGLTGGYGPVEVNGDATQIVCLTTGTSLTLDFPLLSAQHPGCTGGAAALTGACYAASDRYCKAHGYAGGLGVLEFNGSAAQIFCFASGSITTGDYSIDTIDTNKDGCTTADPSSLNCLVASKRLCVAQGHSAGYGLVEVSATVGQVNCLN